MDQILNINLDTQTAPKIQEASGKDWIEYGTDDYRNLYPQFLIDLYYNSSTHAAIINATADMIAGESINVEQENNLDAYVKLKKFIANPNGKESLHDIIKKISFDFKLQGGFALNVVWSKDRTEIAELYHIPVERIRAGKPNSRGMIDKYYISADWSDIRKNKPQPVPAFNLNDRTNPSQILYSGSYSPSMDIYYVPDYVGGCNWALIDQRIAEFHLNNIQNGFSGSYFISFANGVPTQEERIKIEQSIAQKFTGTKASGKFVLTFSDDKNRTPEITPISVSNADKQYLALQELMTSNILVAHRVTSPMLMGIKNDTGLGNNADELNSAFEVYLNTVVSPYQNHILKTLQKIFEVNQINLPIHLTQNKPITTKFTLDDMKSVMTQDEIREELGLEPLEGDQVAEDEFSSNEDWSALEEFHKGIPDIPKDWELVDERVVDGEHVDFDYEAEINKITRTELASTGRAQPSARSEQDGVNKSFEDYYKVRYVYTEDEFLTRKSGKSRTFCRLMMSAKKVYRKEDIAPTNAKGEINSGSLSTKNANRGWGPGKGGKTPYDIFLFKGGGNCHHYWLRRIYKTTLRSAKKPISTAKVISYTDAVSEGFTAKRNDTRVAKAPKRMANKGFKNK